jgi:hypothetical protein
MNDKERRADYVPKHRKGSISSYLAENFANQLRIGHRWC